VRYENLYSWLESISVFKFYVWSLISKSHQAGRPFFFWSWQKQKKKKKKTGQWILFLTSQIVTFFFSIFGVMTEIIRMNSKWFRIDFMDKLFEKKRIKSKYRRGFQKKIKQTWLVQPANKFDRLIFKKKTDQVLFLVKRTVSFCQQQK